MKTKKEIEALIKTCQDLKDVIPEHNFFGGNNWDRLDKSMVALRQAIGKDKYELEEKVDDLLDTLDSGDALEHPVVAAWDWVLENTDNVPADEADVQIFKTQKKEDEC